MSDVTLGFNVAAKLITITKGADTISLTAKELDDICHAAMAQELLPVLMAEIRGLIRTGGTR